jgi:hypothetical protein
MVISQPRTSPIFAVRREGLWCDVVAADGGSWEMRWKADDSSVSLWRSSGDCDGEEAILVVVD